jgi:hypothetical protein
VTILWQAVGKKTISLGSASGDAYRLQMAGRAICSALGQEGIVTSLAEKLNPSRPESPFVVKKLKYGGYELVFKGDREAYAQHICDFRSEDEAKIWVRENVAKFAATVTEI